MNRGWAHHGWPPWPQPIVFTCITHSPLAYGLIFSGFPKLWIKVDCCLSDKSFWTTSQVLFALDRVPVGSLHFVQFNSADLPCYEILCSGFLNRPLPFGMHLKVTPKGHHIFDRLQYPTAYKHSGCDTCESGLIAQHPILTVILFFRVPEAFAHDNASEWSLLAETLEGTLSRNPLVRQEAVHSCTTFAHWPPHRDFT